ncbi:glutamyl-tRNA reductase [Halalkalirubrum salinum]|uniref:glutamyl-tRNA reductase n=1 Tax=Halalkalirubrum salinum TaxID=2563889 RepID=UPI0010FB3B37|nr:glutamyl-tRNA reductase [Halalkalirubrum salinum]
MFQTGIITGVSVSHVDARVEEIDAASGDSVRAVVSELLADRRVSEAFALQTCNRAEAYVVVDSAADGRSVLSDRVSHVRSDAVTWLSHEESIRHLMRVAAGLESLVLGEDQIIGQFKTAIDESRAVGGIATVLDETLMKAVHVGETARTETAINQGVLSLGSAAVELAQRELNLDGSSALIVGAGEMGLLSARALSAAGVDRLTIANRTVPHAEHIAAELDIDASAVHLDAIQAAAADVDVLISATNSPEHLISQADLTETDQIVCIDIAQPHDIEPAADAIDGVSLYDIDSLEAVTEETRSDREAAAEAVEAIIDEEFDRLLASFKRKQADEAIRAMYEGAERVKTREVATALTKLEANGDLTDEQRAIVESLADALVGQLLAAPTKSLREAAGEDDWTTIQTAMKLFDPGFDDPPMSPSDIAGSEIPTGSDQIPQHVLERISDD